MRREGQIRRVYGSGMGQRRREKTACTHPNRSRRSQGPAANPAPHAIRAARLALGLSQTEAGALIYVGLRAWQQYEAGDRRLHPGLWELWQIKTKTRQTPARAARAAPG